MNAGTPEKRTAVATTSSLGRERVQEELLRVARAQGRAVRERGLELRQRVAGAVRDHPADGVGHRNRAAVAAQCMGVLEGVEVEERLDRERLVLELLRQGEGATAGGGVALLETRKGALGA